MRMKTGADIQLLAIDLDGTMLRSDATLSPKVKEALQYAISKQVLVVPCTGRAFGSLSPQILAVSGIDYVITSNGAAIDHLPTKQKIYRNLLEKDIALSILDAVEHLDVMIEVFVEGKAYTEQRFLDNLTQYGTEKNYIPYVMGTRTPIENIRVFTKETLYGIENINIKIADTSLREQLWKQLEELQTVSITGSSHLNIEVSALNTGKAEAVAHLCSQLGIALHQVMAIGDSLNDIGLLKQSGFAVAMENGIDQVKQVADYITLSNAEDGVAHAIERFLVE